MRTALSIAGSDSCGGAGIQADLKTMTLNGVYAMSAVTALTAQNTTGVTDVLEVPPAFLQKQLDAVFTDIFPDAVKIGMVSSSPLIQVIAERLRHYGAGNIVVDPVMVATSGSRLMRTDAVDTLAGELLPMAALVTPNIPEGEILAALRSPIPPRTINGVKRRCGAGMGRCQGGFCGPRVHEILARELHADPKDILMDQPGTYLITGETKEAAAHV